MDELVLYVTQGDPADKHAQESLGAAASIHRAQQHATFRHAECPPRGAAASGFGAGERLFVAGCDRALITSYAWGKETPDQKFPVPEQMACLALAHFPAPPGASLDAKTTYRVPWLLAAGLVSGKVYVWELALGDLVSVHDAHYQAVSALAFSPCGTFLVSGGLDARVHVWRTLDLLAAGDARSRRPHAAFTDHALAVTTVAFAGAPLATDLRVVSAARDGTLRVYNVAARTLETTLVFPAPVECFARDPAGRAYYAGLADGTVRLVAMHAENPHSHVLEPVGGAGRIVTVALDPEMRSSFGHHAASAGAVPTAVAVAADGMSIVSGDSHGRVFVADVATRQVVKAFTPCKLAIAYLHVGLCSLSVLADAHVEKRHRLLPPLKRVLSSGVPAEHTVTVQLLLPPEHEPLFAAWLDMKAEQETALRLPSAALDTKAVQAKLDTVSAAYTELRERYEELLAVHQTG